MFYFQKLYSWYWFIMKNKICCGFGHREIFTHLPELKAVLEDLIVNEHITGFMIGDIGEFDREFASSVRSLKSKYSHIELYLIKPYFSNKLNTYQDYYECMFDSVIIPPEVVGAHYKSAITKTNKWMVDNSDVIVSYIFRDFGGAYNAIKYAAKLNKRVIDLYNLLNPKND